MLSALSAIDIQNYRGFKEYRLEGLARVNLLVGKNNCGKTALLGNRGTMMTGDPELASLYVEDTDDRFCIMHLLERHGFSFELPQRAIQICPQGGAEKLLEAMPVAVRASTGRPVAFVLDADVPVRDRWRQVRGRLEPLGLLLPPLPPAEGYHNDLPDLKVRVGVWIMPDNAMDYGKLEDMLRTLVPADDPLIDHAESATAIARSLGARFPEPHRIKAVLHAWLAWQQDPGCPFGTAIKTRYFMSDSGVAVRFVAWFRRLFSTT